MNRISLFFFIISLFVCANMSCQKFSIDFSFGYSQFGMGDLKKFNDKVMSTLPFETAITDDFPNNIEYKISPLFQLSHKVTVGGSWSTTSTGSRIHVKDYSGEYSGKIFISQNSYGIVGKIGPLRLKKLAFYQNNNVGLTKSKVRFDEYFQLFEEQSDTIFNYKALSFFYEPTVQCFYTFGFIDIGISCGYFIDFQKEFSSTKDDNQYFYINKGDRVKSDWNGMRYSIIIKIKPTYFIHKASSI